MGKLGLYLQKKRYYEKLSDNELIQKLQDVKEKQDDFKLRIINDELNKRGKNE